MVDIRQGDCLELMKEIPNESIDMILCDLPYEKYFEIAEKRINEAMCNM